MRAAVMHAFGEPLRVQTVADPAPAPDGVVVEVRATGVCRSDWHAWMGHADKLERARALGAARTVDARDGDPVAAIAELTGGGAHVSLDALGSAATCAASVWSLRRQGRHVQVGLLLADERAVALPIARTSSSCSACTGWPCATTARCCARWPATRSRPAA